MDPTALHVRVGLMDVFHLERNTHEAIGEGADDLAHLRHLVHRRHRDDGGLADQVQRLIALQPLHRAGVVIRLGGKHVEVELLRLTPFRVGLDRMHHVQHLVDLQHVRLLPSICLGVR